MRTKKIILLQVILTILIISGYYTFNLKNSEKSIAETQYLYIKKLQKDFNNYSFSPEIPIISSSGDTLVISDLADDKKNLKKIGFRFSEIHCNSCVNRDIILIKKLANKIGWDNVLLFASSRNMTQLRRYKKVIDIESDIYLIPFNSFPLDDETIDTPYIFIFDNDFKLKNLFISMKTNEQRTKDYLNNISG